MPQIPHSCWLEGPLEFLPWGPFQHGHLLHQSLQPEKATRIYEQDRDDNNHIGNIPSPPLYSIDYPILNKEEITEWGVNTQRWRSLETILESAHHKDMASG